MSVVDSMFFSEMTCNYRECFSSAHEHVPCACARASCTWIVYAWLPTVPEVLQCLVKEAASLIWRRGSQPLVCAVTSVEGFLRQGAKGEDSRGGEALSVLGVQPCLPTCSLLSLT